MHQPKRLDPMDMSKHGRAKVQPLQDVLEIAATRAKGYENLDVDRISDLKIGWHDTDASHRDSGWYAKVGSRDLILSDQAVRSASKLIGQHDPRHWKLYPDRNAFPTALAHILDNSATSGNRKNPKRLLVRHDGIKIRAILPFTYKIRDAAEMLGNFADQINRSVGEIQGVSVLEDGEPGDLCSYRIVMNQNIMPSLRAEFGQFMMFLLAVSETGWSFAAGADAATSLGLFCTSCTNSAIRASLTSKWNHRTKTQDKFFGDSTERIRTTGYYQNKYTRIFNELLNAKLDVSPPDLLKAFHGEKLITSGHYDAAELYVREKTEDGRRVETQYDLFNVLTRSAQDLPSLTQRQTAETRTLHLFTESGGIFERLRNAAQERAKQLALRRGGNLEARAAAEDEA